MPHLTNEALAPRILFLDAYDSFSNNIAALLAEQIGAEVVIVKIDDSRYLNDNDRFLQLLKTFDAVLAGPGPGSPTNKADVGLIDTLWALSDNDLLPVLGICLGFQSLAYVFGAQIDKLKEPRHGVTERVHHADDDIFRDTGKVITTQYHSLHARLFSEAVTEEAKLWKASTTCPDLVPLGWVFDAHNGPTLMAVKHRIKPFWGVQFHPESICSVLKPDVNIIVNWWKEAQKWSTRQERRKSTYDPRKRRKVDQEAQTRARSQDPLSDAIRVQISKSVSSETIPLAELSTSQIHELVQGQSQEVVLLESGLLSSGRPVNPETGRFSIISVLDDKSLHVEYRTSSGRVSVFKSAEGQIREPVINDTNDIFAWLKDFMKRHVVHEGQPSVPFWGGLVGYISYEACLDTNLETAKSATSKHEDGRPGMAFVFVERSIVIDHVEKQIYIQTLRKADDDWLKKTLQLLQSLSGELIHPPSAIPRRQQDTPLIHGPTSSAYCAKVLACQSKIRAGESYELCLTDATHIHCCPRDPWQLYNRLRRLNPAPFSAYFNLRTSDSRFARNSNKLTLLSSSPERFLSWTRPQSLSPRTSSSSSPTKTTQTVQFRPIKGTLQKTPFLLSNPSQVEALLATPKERAENLMIVDLIRHDLHGVVGAGNVRVSKLMGVEEYETVWQLVSVIEGTLVTDIPKGRHVSSSSISGAARESEQEDNDHEQEQVKSKSKSPIDVLAASLPPGSMTGAPKKRSCEILQQLEGRPRGIYSGVLGYLDVGGGGDFSVIIRTAWRWGDDVVEDGEEAEEEHEVKNVEAEEVGGDRQGEKKSPKESWHIGAGGAVTSQSTDEGEWEEMLGKRAAVLRLFTDDERTD